MSTLPSVNLNNLYAAFGSSASGIDVTSAVNQILTADRAIETQWQSQQSAIDQQTSALNQINSLASSLMDKLNALQDPTGALMATNVSSTNSAVVSATAIAGTPAGSHVISVQNLATTASWYSDAVATSTTPFAAGSFDLTVGSGSSQTTTTIAIGSGVNTPSDLATYINGLNLGVTASVITDANGARVALVSNASGSASDFSIQPTSSNVPNLFTRAATGANASLTVDGVPISSATNTVSGVINGVTLSLRSQAPGSQVVLTVAPDTTSAAQAINGFVDYYNALVTQVNSQFAYDPTSKSSGPLSTDSTVRMLQSALLASPSYSAASGTFTTLRSLGITMNDDGTLTADSATLNAALQNTPSAVQAFFQGTAANGFAASLKSALNSFADPSEGSFTVDLKSLSNTRSDLQDQIDNYENYLAGVQTSLTAKYNQANILLLQLPQMQKWLDAMLGNNSNGSNG
jgi:flagellar hook-associated protein 2